MLVFPHSWPKAVAARAFAGSEIRITSHPTPPMVKLLSFAILCHFAAIAAYAQQTGPDVIRGKVTDDSSHAIVARIMVTRGPDRLTQEATTDSAGNFRVRFEEGTGDY